MADCIGAITSKYDSMTRSERKVADFVIGSLHEAVQMNVHEFSRAAGVSEASVLRFCRRLGYEGFRDFCLQMARNMSNDTDDYIVAMQNNISDLEQRVSRTLLASVETIRMTLSNINYDSLRQAAILINHCRNLMFIGMGTSGIVCQDAALRFLRAGRHAVSFGDFHTSIVATSYYDSRDVVVGISHSGNTREVCETMRIARQNGAHTIGITTYPNENIGNVSDVLLLTCIREIPMYKIAITSRTSQLAVIDALFLAVLMENYDTTITGLVSVYENIVGLNSADPGRSTKVTNNMKQLNQEYTIEDMVTEQANPNTTDFDLMPIGKLLDTINAEDQLVALAVHRVLPQIEKIVEQIIDRFGNGGRILYMGAGTSGRIAVMDAAEFPPTFGIPPERVQVLMAGGEASVFRAQETHEDDAAKAEKEVKEWKPTPLDCVIGLATSGKTPYVLSGLKTARAEGAFTALICANPVSETLADVVVSCITGPEVLTGSTRLKAGTAQKMILNMISTASMVKLGRTYGNRMCHITSGNLKLNSRTIETVSVCCGVPHKEAETLLKKAEGNLALSLVIGLTDSDLDQARKYLDLAKGNVRVAVNLLLEQKI